MSTNWLGMRRREFLAVAAAVVLPGLAGAQTKSGPKALAGSQLYGWGQYYERMGKSVARYLDEVLSGVRDAGFDYAEGNLDTADPERNGVFAAKCKARGLRPVSLYTGARLHEQRASDQTVKAILAAAPVCRDAGFEILNCNADVSGRLKTDEELATQAAGFSALGEGLRKLGMRLGVHHHTPEMRDHAKEFHYNFQHSEKSLVGFCYDVHWVFRGGVMPEEALAKYGERVVSWHLRQSRQGIWWEDLDAGDVDYDAVSRYAREHGLAPYFTVELALENGTKVTRSVVENHRRSREYVRRVFGA